jgi:hypothetical protein
MVYVFGSTFKRVKPDSSGLYFSDTFDFVRAKLILFQELIRLEVEKYSFYFVEDFYNQSYCSALFYFFFKEAKIYRSSSTRSNGDTQ